MAKPNRIRYPAAAFCALALVVVAWADQPAFYGTVIRVEGRPMARAGGEEAVLTKGRRIEENGRVITGEGDLVILKLSTGEEIVVMENSDMAITRKTSGDTGPDIVTLIQKSGFTWSRVPPSPSRAGPNRFKVATPSSVAGIRGTSFSAQVDPKTGEEGFCVCEGVIDVTSGGKTGEVRAGEYLGVARNADPGKPFGDIHLLKYPSRKTMQCLTCHQAGGTRDGLYGE
ncbi:FecR domain-containing protein [bacterium]|nr:FecR domain-containing protein [bacterium]